MNGRSHHTKPFLIAERLSARHLILQHALGRCIFVRHAPLSVTLYCPSRSLFGRHAPLSVTLFYACAKGWQGRDTRVHAYIRTSSRVGRMDGGVHARPNAWAFARALDGRRGYGETLPSTSASTRWMDGWRSPHAWAFARALDGRRGYGETSPSTSARAIDCARHMYAHSAYT